MLYFKFIFAFVALPLLSTCSPAQTQHPFLPEPTDGVAKRAPSTWVHPGVLVSKQQLDFVKAQVAAGAQPWSGAFGAMLSDPIATSTRTPHATYTTVTCGPTSNPNIGCSEEREDALAAYANSLAFWITNDQKYAQKAIAYMNAWAKTLKLHAFSNSKLQEGWSASSWSRAAEIMAHSNSNWASADQDTFKTFLRNVYLNNIIGGSDSNGNWELVMMEAAIGISVFLEDSASYDTAMNIFLKRVPEYVYLTSDGSTPKLPPGKSLSSFWYGEETFPENGIAQETCRDLTHTGYGLESISHVSETSRHQGTDLFQTDVGTRLRYGLGFHSQFIGQNPNPIPDYLCNHKTHLNATLGPSTEVGLNAMHFRLGYPMANTLKWTLAQRPADGGPNLFYGWETLTHASQPN